MIINILYDAAKIVFCLIIGIIMFAWFLFMPIGLVCLTDKRNFASGWVKLLGFIGLLISFSLSVSVFMRLVGIK